MRRGESGRRGLVRLDNTGMSKHSRGVARALTLIIASLLTMTAVAQYVQVEIENVPINRLVTNLEALVAASPVDVRLKFNLARVHAMAFAKKAGDVPTWKGRQKEGVWFGHRPANVPYGPVEPGRAEQQAAARAHLDKAIALHAEVIAARQRAATTT